MNRLIVSALMEQADLVARHERRAAFRLSEKQPTCVRIKARRRRSGRPGNPPAARHVQGHDRNGSADRPQGRTLLPPAAAGVVVQLLLLLVVLLVEEDIVVGNVAGAGRTTIVPRWLTCSAQGSRWHGSLRPELTEICTVHSYVPGSG